MDTLEIVKDIEKLEKEKLPFDEFVHKLKELCNNFALKLHNQSTFIIDTDKDFLAEVFSKEESFFVIANKRFDKLGVITYQFSKD